MNQYIFNPCEESLIDDILKTKKEIIIFCPFIKNSILKKILSKLSFRNISIKIVTRFNKQVFIQKSSDIDFMMLQFSNELDIDMSIYQLNLVHAKIFIIDRNIMHITSSNLTYSGLNKNYEAGVRTTNTTDIENVAKILNEKIKTLKKVTKEDIYNMNILIKEELKKNIIYANTTLDSEEYSQEKIENFISDENKYEYEYKTEKEIKAIDFINNFLFSDEIKNFIKIKERDLISCTDFIPKDLNENDKVIAKKMLNEKAYSDLAYLKEYLNENFRRYFSDAKLEEFSNIFIQNSWVNIFQPKNFKKDISEFYAEMGKHVHKLLIIENILKHRLFSTDSVGYYSILADEIKKKYPYYRALENIGLNFILSRGELKTNISQTQYNAILSFFITNSDIEISNIYNSFFSFDENFINDYIEIDIDFKTKLQNIFSEDLYKPVYNTISKTGSQDDSIFTVMCSVNNKKLSIGTGKNTKLAEKDAAQKALRNINEEKIKIHKNSQRAVKKYYISKERYLELENININTPFIHSNIQLLDIALTHKSIVNEQREKRSYEKLSLLGSILERISIFINEKDNIDIKILKEKLRTPTENMYSKAFDDLNIYKNIKILPHIEINSKIKANVIQALIACIYINSNIKEASKFINKIWEKHYTSQQEQIHPLSLLLERVEKHKNNITISTSINTKEIFINNTKQYETTISIEGIEYGKAHSLSKKDSRKKAAECTLKNPKFINLFEE